MRQLVTATRRALVASGLGAGISYSNLAVALPLLVLAEHGSSILVGALLAAETVAFSLGALLAIALRRSESGVATGLAAIAVGDVLLVSAPVRDALVAGAIVHGIGMGLFWVGVQASLGRRSGAAGSQKVFVGQYVGYVTGSASGAALRRGCIGLRRSACVGQTARIRASFAIGIAGSL